MHGHPLSVLRPGATTVLVGALVSDIVTLVDIRVGLGELDVLVNMTVGVLLTVLVMVLASNVIELAELEMVVVATVMVWIAVLWVEVKDVAVRLRVPEVAVVGIVAVRERQTPQVAPWQETASTTKHQAPPVWPSGLQQ